MAAYLPKRQFNTFGYKWSLNPGPWNSKEHALIVVAYWGSVGTPETQQVSNIDFCSATRLMDLVLCPPWSCTMARR